MENQLVINELTAQLAVIENELQQFKEIEKRQKDIKDKLKTAMENAGVTKWETNSGIKITLIEDTPDEYTIVTKVNEAKFQEENKELFWQYHNTRDQYKEKVEEFFKGKKGYVRITLPKKKTTDTEEIPF